MTPEDKAHQVEQALAGYLHWSVGRGFTNCRILMGEGSGVQAAAKGLAPCPVCVQFKRGQHVR